MTNTLSKLSASTVLISMVKREFWEHKNSFIVLPLALAVFLLLVMFFGLIFIDNFNIDIESHSSVNHSEGINSVKNTSKRNYTIHFGDGDMMVMAEGDTDFNEQFDSNRETINSGLYGINALFSMVAWWVVIFYFLGTLHSDRRDRSILFWKSMPISETKTVLTKLLVGLLAVPFIMTAISWLVQLFYVVAAMFFASAIGQDPWQAIWPYLNIVEAFFNQLGLLIIIGLWLVPLCAWLMLASAFAKRSPFLVATLPIVAIIAIEGIIFDSGYFASFMENHFSLGNRYADVILDNIQLGEFINVTSILSGFVLAAILLTGAIWLRNNRFEM